MGLSAFRNIKDQYSIWVKSRALSHVIVYHDMTSWSLILNPSRIHKEWEHLARKAKLLQQIIQPDISILLTTWRKMNECQLNHQFLDPVFNSRGTRDLRKDTLWNVVGLSSCSIDWFGHISHHAPTSLYRSLVPSEPKSCWSEFVPNREASSPSARPPLYVFVSTRFEDDSCWNHPNRPLHSSWL
jgi:hypothetical protein